MRILDRYVFRSVAAVFFLCLFTFVFLFIIIDLFSHLDVILKMKAGVDLLIHYYGTYLPFVFVQITPFSCLLAVLYAFARLNHDNELIAMRSSGLSVFAISKTVILFGIALSGAIFLVNDRVMPESLQTNQKIRQQLESGTTKKVRYRDEVIHNVAIYGLRNRLFFINNFVPRQQAMEGITILEHDERQNMTRKIVANKGIYENGRWVFYQSITYAFDAEGQLTQEPRFEEREIMSIPESPEEFLDQKQSTDFMSLAQIKSYISKLARSGATTVIRNLRIDYYHRLFAPLSTILIMLLAIPFGMKISSRRTTGLSSLGLSLILGFLYYVLNAVSLALGKAGILEPLVSASLVHMTALAAGVYMIAKIP
jgi:lipopolysaccharide export system permease protein